MGLVLCIDDFAKESWGYLAEGVALWTRNSGVKNQRAILWVEIWLNSDRICGMGGLNYGSRFSYTDGAVWCNLICGVGHKIASEVLIMALNLCKRWDSLHPWFNLVDFTTELKSHLDDKSEWMICYSVALVDVDDMLGGCSSNAIIQRGAALAAGGESKPTLI